MSSPLEATRQDIAHHMLEQARAVVIYLEIMVAFTAVTLFGCMIYLLIW